jgi:hypothetical protein
MPKYYRKQTPVEANQLWEQKTIKTRQGHLSVKPSEWVVNDNTEISIYSDANFKAMFYPVPEPVAAPAAPVVTVSVPVAPEPVVTVTHTPVELVAVVATAWAGPAGAVAAETASKKRTK